MKGSDAKSDRSRLLISFSFAYGVSAAAGEIDLQNVVRMRSG
jgi:hypothetical protein